MKTIKLEKNEDGEFVLEIDQLVDFIDISIIDSYKIEELENGDISILFFDKNGDTIKPYDK